MDVTLDCKIDLHNLWIGIRWKHDTHLVFNEKFMTADSWLHRTVLYICPVPILCFQVTIERVEQ